MPDFRIIFYGLCAFVPRLPLTNGRFAGMTVLLPNVPEGGNVNANLIELFDGRTTSNRRVKQIIDSKNNTFLAHRPHLEIKTSQTTIIHSLVNEEIEILIDGAPLNGDVIMQPPRVLDRLFNHPVDRIANLKQIFSDRPDGSKVKPNMLNYVSQTPESLGLAARLTFKGGTFAAYNGSFGGNSTLATQDYVFYKHNQQNVQEIMFGKDANPMAGAAVFFKEIQTGKIVNINVFKGTSKQPLFQSTGQERFIEISIKNMPTSNSRPRRTRYLEYTDTDFFLLYKDIANEPQGFRIPDTTIPGGGVRPPLLCGVALFHEQSLS